METPRLLLDAECPVTKAKLNEDLRWYTVNVGDTLLELTAKSCCSKKGALVLDRIMAARNKERKNKIYGNSLLGRKDALKYNFEELSTLGKLF